MLYRFSFLFFIFLVFNACTSQNSAVIDKKILDYESAGSPITAMSAGSPAAAALFLMLDISNAINFNLNSKEIKMHNDAIYLALNNSSNGEIVSWHSGQRLASGKARVIMTFHLEDEYCRTFQSYIKLNGAEKHETKTFCKKNNVWHLF